MSEKLDNTTAFEIGELYEPSNANKYQKIYNFVATNEFASINGKNELAKEEHKFDTETGNLIVETQNSKFMLSNIKRNNINDIKGFGLNTQATQLLDILCIKLAKQLKLHATPEEIAKNSDIKYSVKEYMEDKGLADYTTAKEQLKNAGNALYNTNIVCKGELINADNKKEPYEINTRILGATTRFTRSGDMTFHIETALVKVLTNSYLMPLNKEMYKIPIKKFNHAYLIGRKMQLHHNMNINKPNANNISVKTLLEACPELPKYDDVMKNKNGHVTQLIINPFINNLDELDRRNIINYEWWLPNNEKISDEEYEKLINYKTPYKEFENYVIHFELIGYPEEEIQLIRASKKAKLSRLNKKKQRKSQ